MKYTMTIAIALGAFTLTPGQSNVGINTNSPVASLHVNGSAIVESNLFIGDTSVSILPVRLLYYNDSLSALRYGFIVDEEWSPMDMGLFSFAGGANSKAPGGLSVSLGSNNVASGIASVALGNGSISAGDHAMAFGSNTLAQGDQAVAIGQYTTANGPATVALGYYTEANGPRSTALGDRTIAHGLSSTAIGTFSETNGDISTAMGYGLVATGYSSTVVGMYNDSLIATQTEATTGTPLFVVGNGENINRSNALVVYKNGLTHVDGMLQVGSGSQFNEIQSGTSVIGSNPGGGVKSSTITFPEGAFSSAPRVICTIRGINAVDTFVASTTSVSTTVFVVNVFRVDNGGGNWGQNLQLDWIAFN